MTSTDEEARALALLGEAGDAIVAGVARELPGWVERSVTRILDAWGRTAPDVRERTEREAVAAGVAASARVVGELRALLALDPAEQSATPLEIVRRAYREPTAVLAAVGIPGIEREEFDERAWPDDAYGLVIRGLRDLGPPGGDGDLGAYQLAWGLAKAKVLRARVEADDRT